MEDEIFKNCLRCNISDVVWRNTRGIASSGAFEMEYATRVKKNANSFFLTAVRLIINCAMYTKTMEACFCHGKNRVIVTYLFIYFFHNSDFVPLNSKWEKKLNCEINSGLQDINSEF